MSTALLSAVTLAYVGIALSECVKGNYSMALVFTGYSLANVGLIIGVAA